MNRLPFLVLTVALVFTATGCTHTQLALNTSRQAGSVADVQTTQVLDNLARFAHNPDSLPHFSYPNAGASNVNDSVNGSTGFSFGSSSVSPGSLANWMFGFGGSRGMGESYTMTPVNDPKKLEVMRCAFQRAVSPCFCNGESSHCPNCEKRFSEYYLGSEIISKTGRITPEGHAVYVLIDDVTKQSKEVYARKNEFNETQYIDGQNGYPIDVKIINKAIAATPSRFKRLYVDNTVAEQTYRSGKVTAECLHSCCWLNVGKKCDVPSRCECSLVGHYCDTYIWVPECHRDQLTKLTLTILDIAINDPAEAAPAATKDVVVYLDRDYKPANKSTATYKISGTISAGKDAKTIVAAEKAASALAKAKAKAKEEAAQKNQEAEKAFIDALQADAPGLNSIYSTLSLSIPDPSQVGVVGGVSDFADSIRKLAEEKVTYNGLSEKDKAVVNRMKELADDWRNANTKLQASEDATEDLGRELDEAPATLPDRRATPVPGAGYLQFEQNLRTLGGGS